MGKHKRVPTKVSPKKAKKKPRRRAPVLRRCAKCLERHEAPTGKKCVRLQTPGLQVGTDPVLGPSGLFLPSSSAESISAEEVRLAAARFPSGSSTTDSNPQRPHALPQPRMETDPSESQSEDGSSEDDEPSSEGETRGSDAGTDDEASSGEEDDSDWEDVNEGDHASTRASSKMLEFNRVTTDILDRLERSENRTSDLEKLLVDKQQQLDEERAGRLDRNSKQMPPPV